MNSFSLLYPAKLSELSISPMATASSFVSPLANTLQFPFNSAKTPKPFISSKLSSDNLTTTSTPITISTTSSDSCIQSSQSEPISAVKVPTAPWMRGPLHVEPTEILDLSKPGSKNGEFGKFNRNPDEALTGKKGPGRGKKEMQKIYGGIKKLEHNKAVEKTPEFPEKVKFKFPPGGLFGDGNSDQEELLLEKESGFKEIQNGMEQILFEVVGKGKAGGKLPWNVEEKFLVWKVKKEKVPTAAELILDKKLLYRLRDQAAEIKNWVKVKKAGVTQAVVDQIFFIWKSDELAMVKFDIPLSRNMDRAREIVEMKTGGLVVWKKKDALVVYRGNNSQLALDSFSKVGDISGSNENSTFYGSLQHSIPEMRKETVDKGNDLMTINSSLYEREADRLLDGLGPRFVDWWMQKPLPVDADLLPETVPGLRTQFRLCPPRARPQLTDNELTYLRNLAQSLPTHFVLGRNRRLQGLAASIFKLWEKCHIAKIAIKWGVMNTDNKQMAEELKYLTGGVLLLRNKFFIILYRGKDFLPSQVSELVSKREVELRGHQRLEETVRLNASEELSFLETSLVKSSTVGTLSEFNDIAKERLNVNSEAEVQLEAQKNLVERELRNQQHTFYILKKKLKKSTTRLAEFNSAWKAGEQDTDQEMVTTEERECLRQMGLKMEASVVLGRRGVFKGVIESLHQHWKHREIVKVVTMQRHFSQVEFTAKSLEVESGGVLISIEKLKEGHAIILFRGKNYRRPKVLQANLLNKREALSRSLEMQRIGSLKFFANQREQRIANLRLELDELSKRRIDIFKSS